MLPYLAFPDLQAYGESLSLEQLDEWNERLSGKTLHPEGIRAAMAIFLRELGMKEVSMTINQIKKVHEEFSISMGLLNDIRIGHIEITSGRLTLIDSNAKMRMTKAGIDHVENMIKGK